MTPLWILSTFFTLTELTTFQNHLRIYATRGSSVHLPCPYHNSSREGFYENVIVQWTKDVNQSVCEYYISNVMHIKIVHCTSSFKPSVQGLNATHVRGTDSGFYSCMIIGILPPPTQPLYNTTMELHTEGQHLELKQVNTTDPDCVQLLCTLDGPAQGQVHFIWNARGQNKSGLVNNSLSSSLQLCGAEWEDGDTITCTASYLTGSLKSSWTIHQQKGNNNCCVKIISICAVAGAVLIITIAVIIYICKKRTRAEDVSTVFSNKVYENFSFATANPSRQRTIQTRNEECIYEN